MNIVQDLRDLGFLRVEVLDGASCGIQETRLILCFFGYEADIPCPEERDAVIHAYYPASQTAYRLARTYVQHCREAGLDIRQANEIHIKSILNRLAFLRRGRNTLAYLPEQGSRFHVQILAANAEIPVTAEPEAEEHPADCGSCTRCRQFCPGGAIQENGFVRERCLRYWMMNGKMPPEDLAFRMGNRLIGCDACENCCPMNPPATGRACVVPLKTLLQEYDDTCLADKIGHNYALPNRVLTQACLIAGNMNRQDMLPDLKRLEQESGSEAVRQAAHAALRRLNEDADKYII
ncbi:MAG: hypothetical protein IJJ42_12675 [Clostridia bacterium]|nr:hypothetical protein [Clostridia bacterium]